LFQKLENSSFDMNEEEEKVEQTNIYQILSQIVEEIQ
jgi:hypothetical protein